MMKLNYKRTILVGFAFFSICAFWQVYDTIIPLILRDTYHMLDGPAGVVMALDNVLALFLLPIFGALSDKKGARMPFIVRGTVCAAVLMMLLPLMANAFDAGNTLFGAVAFLAALAVLLVVMGTYRSPAVALMADVTPKPLRSQGNAVINLMGALGGLYTLVMIKVAVRSDANGHADYFLLFLSVAVLMLAAIAVLVLTIRERKLVQAMKDINYGVSAAEDQGKTTEVDGKEQLPAPVKRSLVCVLACIVFWFMGYNAVITAFSKYATHMWSGGLSHASTCLMVGTVAAVISYLPVGMISARFGRKRSIQAGLLSGVASFVFLAFVSRDFSPLLYLGFAGVGFAQAAVTVNTFPMVWEISRVGNIGKYTGYYYTCSMAAQTITPILSGYLLQWFGYHTLLPYGAIMVAIALIPITMAKHGDVKPAPKGNKLEMFDTDD
ncbi:MAG: MFS transporter [Clostridia bacterium]|nr:MFS transporter [Clostridia bacterium]